MTRSTSAEATHSLATGSTTQPKPRLWIPSRVVFTPSVLDEAWGQRILARVQALGLPIEERFLQSFQDGCIPSAESGWYAQSHKPLPLLHPIQPQCPARGVVKTRW
ncbi:MULTISPECIES: hypothetical protein [Aerosakkonema]|uniref:hypothetical protein n=1 Tax=Aerosakkonema TaxID=1246629 RepID=UPI0035BC0729